MTTLADLLAQYRSGQISREQYWLAMQQSHRTLAQYQTLLAGSELSGIEITAGELRVVTSEGLRMVWDPEDIRAAPNVLVNHGCHEPAESPFLLATARDARVVFDVGANVGFYALHFTRRMDPSGIVHAFEPVDRTHAMLLRNIAANRLEQRILPHACGLGATQSEATFYVPDFSGSGAASMVNLHPDERSRLVSARIETLDQQFRAAGLDRLDLVKIDVEGAELMVLQGGMETIRACRPILFLELLRKWSQPFGYHPNEVIELLAGLGYRCWTFADGTMVPFERMTEDTVQTNFMFLLPGHHPEPGRLL